MTLCLFSIVGYPVDEVLGYMGIDPRGSVFHIEDVE